MAFDSFHFCCYHYSLSLSLSSQAPEVEHDAIAMNQRLPSAFYRRKPSRHSMYLLQLLHCFVHLTTLTLYLITALFISGSCNFSGNLRLCNSMPNHLMAAVQLHRLTGVIYCCFPRNSSTSSSSLSTMDKVFPWCFCIYVVDIYPCYKDFCRVFVCVYVYSMLVLLYCFWFGAGI